MKTGIIRGVVNEGTIIGLTIQDDETQVTRTYFGDWRPTMHALDMLMVEAETENPVGLRVAYSVESWGGLASVAPAELAEELWP